MLPSIASVKKMGFNQEWTRINANKCSQRNDSKIVALQTRMNAGVRTTTETAIAAIETSPARPAKSRSIELGVKELEPSVIAT